jgi:penicillin-binding protein 1B
MRFSTPALEQLVGRFSGRRLRHLIAWVLVTPPLLVTAIAAHFWSTAGDLADYHPPEPSRLYAAPVALRVGGPVDARTLRADLESMGYRTAGTTVTQGSYRISPGVVTIGLRRQPRQGEGPGPFAGTNLEAAIGGGRVLALRVSGRDLGPDGVVTLGRPLLYTFYEAELRDCRPVRLTELPAHVVAAVLAAEDASFFRHPGLAPDGILRAAWEDLRTGEVRQGGSTITQQLVKNIFVGNRRTLGRKLREAVLAMLVEARFSKERVLEAYLNEIYWGSAGGANVHGVGAAARAYFGKEPGELTLGEAATLAGMIHSPADSSPTTAPAVARERRDRVLDRMVACRFIRRDAAVAAKRQPLVAHPLPLAARRAPWFAVAMAAEARERFGVERLGGTGHQLLSTLSTLDQSVAEQEVSAGLKELETTFETPHPAAPLEGALVSLEPGSGRIRAWVGGRNWKRSEFDRVATARRQAGSAFKPMVFATALEDGRLVPWELLRDSPVVVGTGSDAWRPRNYDGGFHGDVTPGQALALSLNVPTVRVAMRAGLPRVVEVAHAMGIRSPLTAVPSIALGSCAVTPLELAVAYATLAGDGRRPPAWGLENVVDAGGSSLVGKSPAASQRVLSADTAYEVTSMLRGALSGGTAASARAYGVRGALAGKTGTTDDRRDSWFAGYSADRVTVVWVGYDDNRATRLSGSRGALPIWSRFVARAEPAGGWAQLDAPAGFVSVEVDPVTGLVATPLCPRRTRLELPVGRAPVRECDQHLPQIAYVDPGLGSDPDSLSAWIARSSERAPVRVHDDVTRLFGQGIDIRVGRGDTPATSVREPVMPSGASDARSLQAPSAPLPGAPERR